MRVAIVTPPAHLRTDAAMLRWLGAELHARGHDVEARSVPEPGPGSEERDNARDHCARLDLSEFDAVVSSSAPGWWIPHDCHVVYASGDAIRPPKPGDGPPPAVRRLVVPSEHSARRFEAAGWDQPIMVAPPSPADVEAIAAIPPRIICYVESDERLEIAIEAFTCIDDVHAELLIAGEAEPSGDTDRRLHFLGSPDDATRMGDLARSAAALVLGPDRGWSHLGATAMASGVPLIAAHDAGGVTEIVEHGVNGLLVEPAPDEVNWAIRHVCSSPQLRWSLGLQARRRAAELVTARLADEIDDLVAPRPRPRALTLTTYPVEPMVGGGQRRARFLSRSLAEKCDVTVLVNTSSTDSIRRRLVETGLTQIEVPKSPHQRAAELDFFHAMDRTPVDDITASRLSPATPGFERELRHQLQSADVVIATQPFLVPCIPPTDTPIVHDSQNVETVMKAALLPASPGGRWLLDAVRESESAACERAAVITACTDRDLDTLLGYAAPRVPPGTVVGNGVDTNGLPCKSVSEHLRARAEVLTLAGMPIADDRPIALFIGSWHPPNIEAARLILELAQVRSDWIFVLAGSHTSEFARESVPANVHRIAVFAEPLLWPLLAGADVALNPMRSGGGSNLKLFDYLAVGTAVVTTRTGARGLPEPDRYTIVAEPTVSAFSSAIDRALPGADEQAHRSRQLDGRRLVESSFDWQTLGSAWTTAVLDGTGLRAGPRRLRTKPERRPVLSSIGPPSSDPVIATIQMLGQQARTAPPSPQEVSMDPALRERLKRAKDNRHIGRVLPDDARFAAPKKALIRLGQAFTNEQVIYNQAMVEAVEQLAVSMRAIEAEQRDLRTALDELAADHRELRRRIEGPE